MPAVPITIVGIQTDEQGSRNVTITGMASLTGLGVGGGPIMPGDKPPGIWPSPPEGIAPHPEHPIAPGGKPPTIWPSPGHPEHPIYLPPGIWPNPPEGQAPHPEHPIVIPPPEGVPPDTPPLQVKVVWTPQSGWQVVLIPTGAHPAPSK